MTKDEFKAKLQMVYVGDRNAFNELIGVYDNLLQKIDKTIELIHSILENPEAYSGKDNVNNLLSILKGEEVK